ncbi:beta strand repeat-containing protein [Halpernia frigidisoli]|uniref:Uncharacterized protein n=1 Tax=Halpernia frigidisoli TaxID=1125876 RepID=A0A1I3FDW6_9FLAO|nr:T9SS type A sorting domain-containing protein [Halpernia frigidisoli]SFI09405.1 hypothetical protein SAMN05443292_1316 [Halpernia frigidisoli]
MKKNLHFKEGFCCERAPKQDISPFFKNFFFLIFTFFSVGIFGQYSYSFSTSVFSTGVNSETKSLGSANWTLTTLPAGSTFRSFDSIKGLQFGSAAAPATTATLTTSSIAGTITSVIIYTSGAAAVAGNCNVTVGGNSFTCANTLLTATSTAYTFIGSSSGQINISWNQTSSKALYIKQIDVNYVAGKTSNGTGGGDWNSPSTWIGGVIPSSTDNVTISSGDVVFTSTTLLRAATTNVNGSFQLNTGGYASGTNFSYGTTGTLIFNNSSSYGVNNTDIYWPFTNGPVNVKVLQGGFTLNTGTTRTITGNLDTSAGITIAAGENLTVNGVVTINPNGFFSSTPIYGSSSTLVYNNSPGYNVGNEWTSNASTAGKGTPQNVSLFSSIVNLPNSDRSLAGNLIIDSGSTLNLNGTSGDLYIAGNWTNNKTFNANNRAVFFNGSVNQTISGATTFDYLTLNNLAGVTLLNSIINNKTLDFINGKLTLGANNLTIGSAGTTVNTTSAKYIVTNSTGQLKRIVGASNILFPVGNSSYNPITFNNSGTTDVYGVKVLDGALTTGVDNTKTINRSWITTETVSGGSNLSVFAQYNSGEENSGYSASTNNFIGFYDGLSFTQVAATSAGSNPVIVSSNSNLNPIDLTSGTQYFAIGRDNGLFAPPATKLSFVSVPSTGISSTNLSTFTVEARGSTNYVDPKYTGNITLSKASGNGNLSGTLTAPAVKGIATFNDIQFDLADIYSLSATSGSLTSATSGTITISLNPANAYFRSNVTTGNWSSTSSWETSANGNTGWSAATLSPTSAANTITIRSGNTITINAPVVIDQVLIANGGILAPSSSFTVSDGAGDDIIIQNGGILRYSTNSLPTFSGSATISDETGGNILVSAGGVINNIQTPNYIYKDASILEYNFGSNAFAVSSNLFPNVNISTIPVFKISSTPNGVGGSSDFLVNGLMEVTGSVSFSASGSKIFRNGIRGNGTITQNSGSGTIILGDANSIPLLIGSPILNVLSAGLQIPNGLNIPLGSSPTITSGAENNSITRTGGNITIDGVLDITNIRVTNTAAGSIIVNGTLKTANSGGIYNNNSAIPSGAFILNTNSTIEYNAAIAQIISSTPNYFNITFSGGGTKTTQGPINVDKNGLVKITGNTTVNALNNITSITGNNTGLTMDSGRLILSTGGTLPLLNGNYNLTGGTVEFASSSVTIIKTSTPPKQYYNIDVTGSNVTSGGKNLIVNNLLNLTNSTAVLNIPESNDSANPALVFAKNGLNVTTGAVFHLLNNAILLQDDAAVNTGKILMDRKAILPLLGYNYWSAPVSSQPLTGNTFSPGTPDANIFRYNEPNDKFYPTGDTSFQTGKAYAIRGGSADDGINPHTFTFTGNPNNGSKNTPVLSYTDDSHGYNLIGNPYPSILDFDTFYNANFTAMYKIAYFWTNNTYTPGVPQQGSSYSGANYAIYNATGGNPAATQGSLITVTPTSLIKAGQGFIVQMKSSASLNFTNAMRPTNPGGSAFFNNKKDFVEKDRFHISLATPSDITNTLLVGYVEGATNDYDKDFDADLIIEGSDSFYSRLGTGKLAIQGRQFPFLDDDVVQLGAVFYETGLHKISMSDKEGIFNGIQNVYLKDNLSGETVNLSESDYTFSAVRGSDENRFEIIYQTDKSLGLSDALNKNDIIVYRDKNSFIVKSGGSLIDKIEIYDVSRKKIDVIKVNSTQQSINAEELNLGVYLLKIFRDKDEIIKKIMR